MLVDLTDEDRERARQVGRARTEFHRQRGTPGGHGLKVDRKQGLHYDMIGAISELAVAKALNRLDEWVEVVEDFKALPGDIGVGVQVRSRPYSWGDLLLHKSDHDDHIFVLVKTHVLPHQVDIRGWARAGDVKRDEFWKTFTGRPCYFVPENALNPGLPRCEWRCPHHGRLGCFGCPSPR